MGEGKRGIEIESMKKEDTKGKRTRRERRAEDRFINDPSEKSQQRAAFRKARGAKEKKKRKAGRRLPKGKEENRAGRYRTILNEG